MPIVVGGEAKTLYALDFGLHEAWLDAFADSSSTLTWPHVPSQGAECGVPNPVRRTL